MNYPPIFYQLIFPRMRYLIGFGRWIFALWTRIRTFLDARPASSPALPDIYTVENLETQDSEFRLNILWGELPQNIEGSLFIAQCLGSPGAYMVGDTNILRLDFLGDQVRLKTRLLMTPASIARSKLTKSIHRFDFLGLMYLSPGLGIHSYTEGVYLMADGRIAVTSDIDRPWLIDPKTLDVESPIGRRDEWMPMMRGSVGSLLGELFAGYNNSHVLSRDHYSDECFLVNYQLKQSNGEHPVDLIRWAGQGDFEKWRVLDPEGNEIEIKQSVHELVFSRDFILLTDTAFAAGQEMLTPWVSPPLPAKKTIVHVIDRSDLIGGAPSVGSISVEIDTACIHLLAEYDNPDDEITVYMLHTPATNTAEIIRENDRDLEGRLFPRHVIGHGPLPGLTLSSVGKHTFSGKTGKMIGSTYLSHPKKTWGPYLQTYFARQLKAFEGQDLFVMFKGFNMGLLPQRIVQAYGNFEDRETEINPIVSGEEMSTNPSVSRINPSLLEIRDTFQLPDKTHLFTIACLDSTDASKSGFILAAIVTDDKTGSDSSGHEFWLLDAKNLSKGPICKLGHPKLNISTLFHSVFIPKMNGEANHKQRRKYRVSMREDYPRSEVAKWGKSVVKVFEDHIWPRIN